MAFRHTLRALTLAPVLAASGCLLFDTNHRPDPETALQDALAPLSDEEAEPVDPFRLRSRVEAVALEHPTYLPAQLSAGELALAQGATASAQLHSERAMALAPTDPEARLLRARLAVADGDLRLALELLDDGILFTPERANLHETRAWVLQLQEEWDAAEEALEEAERLGSPAGRIAYNRGVLFERRGDRERAAEAYRTCIDAAAPGSGDRDAERARARLLGLGF